MKTITSLLIFSILCSCSSAPVNIRHYLLNTPNIEVPSQKDQTLPVTLVKKVNIADYLNQSSLVMLLDQHEIYYSPQDVWAEPLQSAFYHALLQDLNRSNTHIYVGAHSPLADKASTTVIIDLAHFHTTHLSSVVATGNYWLSTANHTGLDKDELSINENSFYYELDLQQDGFAHAVSQLRETVNKLSEQIKQDIAVLPNK